VGRSLRGQRARRAPAVYAHYVENVIRRPELLGRDEVLLVKQGLERFEDKCLVSLGCKFAHFGSPLRCRQQFSPAYY